MKKIIKLVIGIFVLILLFELIGFVFKTHHNISYEINKDKTKFTVGEVFKDKRYYFKISSGKYIFSFDVKNDFHKSKEVIKDIYSYKFDDTLCIYPVLKKGNSNILCSRKGKSYSYTYYEKDLVSFVSKLKSKGFKSLSWEKKSNYVRKNGTLEGYLNNIKEDTYIYIYKYNGFFSLNRDSLEKIDLFKDDTYVNHLGTNVSKYYLVPNYDDKYDYDEIYVIDMTKDKVKKRKIKNSISKDSYINGVIDDYLYIFDKDELKQYKISKKGNKIIEVGNRDDGGLYYDLGFKTIDIYKFTDDEILFKTVDDYIDKLQGKTSVKFIEKYGDSYFYQTVDNDVFYYNVNSGVKVLLFNMDISDFRYVSETLYFISGDKLYSYDFDRGISLIATYGELSFNSKNRIAIYSE